MTHSVGITSCIAHTTGIVHQMSNSIVSFPAFLEVAGLQIGLLLCEHVAVCEIVNEVGRINVLVYAESRFRLPWYQVSMIRSSGTGKLIAE